MSIFYLENILNQGIGRQTVAEVLLGFLESLALDLSATMLHHEVVEEGRAFCSLVDLINAHCVVDHFNKTTVGTSSKDFISLKPEWKLFNPKDLIDLGNKLHGELLLSHVIKRFDDDSD